MLVEQSGTIDPIKQGLRGHPCRTPVSLQHTLDRQLVNMIRYLMPLSTVLQYQTASSHEYQDHGAVAIGLSGGRVLLYAFSRTTKPQQYPKQLFVGLGFMYEVVEGERIEQCTVHR